MRIAVTGASGFVGQHVMRTLLAEDVDVVAVLRPTSIGHFKESVEVVSMDLANHGHDPFARMGRPDALIHLAWGGLPQYQSNRHIDTELPIQLAFLECCIRSGLKHLVVTGTCLEYGLQTGELDESQPADPVSSYGKAKDLLRRDLERLQAQYGFGLTWLRMFYLYGPGQAATSLYSQLKAAVARRDATFAMSRGDQVRDFMPVQEAARCIAQIGSRGIDGNIVNLCSSHPQRVVEAARAWLREWNASLELSTGVLPYPEYEPFAFWGNRAKLDSLLGAAT
ncbi:MAG: NAD-dependent epimerase/dehydratase [Xanthomonadaceae bacterium]|nr:NAD-dependent epimerase/dehydratase [Xanthomonadaceae bacterium]